MWSWNRRIKSKEGREEESMREEITRKTAKIKSHNRVKALKKHTYMKKI